MATGVRRTLRPDRLLQVKSPWDRQKLTQTVIRNTRIIECIVAFNVMLYFSFKKLGNQVIPAGKSNTPLAFDFDRRIGRKTRRIMDGWMDSGMVVEQLQSFRMKMI